MSTGSIGVEAVEKVASSTGRLAVDSFLITAGLGCVAVGAYTLCKVFMDAPILRRMEADILKDCQNVLKDFEKALNYYEDEYCKIQNVLGRMNKFQEEMEKILSLDVVDITRPRAFLMRLDSENPGSQANTLLQLRKERMKEDVKEFQQARNTLMAIQEEFEKDKRLPAGSLGKLQSFLSSLQTLQNRMQYHSTDSQQILDLANSALSAQLKITVDNLAKSITEMNFDAKDTNLEDYPTSTSRRSERVYRKALKGKVVPKAVRVVIEEQLKKLKSSTYFAGENEKTEDYLRWLTCIPWGITTKDVLDVKKAQAILDEEHYGMVEVKDRIMEFIAIAVMRDEIPKGKVICLHGPPGVGKTSIAKCIAKALNRKYYRINVAGAKDASLLKGHQICYIGSAPGRIVDCLKAVQTLNALVLIDEVDKIYGRLSSTFLEVLDPSQNESFKDDYLNVPVDISKMLFVCTANEVDEIPEPLKDRMEMILVKGYKNDEKIAIVEQYLIPKFIKEVGLTREKLSISPEAVKILVEKYCPEKGVRSLERHLEKVARKATRKIVMEDLAQVKVDESNIEEFLGESEIEANRDIISRMYN